MSTADDFLALSGAVATDALQGQQALADRVQALEDAKAALERDHDELVADIATFRDECHRNGQHYHRDRLQTILDASTKRGVV